MVEAGSGAERGFRGLLLLLRRRWRVWLGLGLQRTLILQVYVIR